jgi:hypothetical protein
MDDANPKIPKALRSRQGLRKLFEELAEGALSDDTPLSPEERAEALEFGAKLKDFARAYGAWLEAEKPLWGERAAEKNERSGDGHDR